MVGDSLLGKLPKPRNGQGSPASYPETEDAPPGITAGMIRHEHAPTTARKCLLGGTHVPKALLVGEHRSTS